MVFFKKIRLITWISQAFILKYRKLLIIFFIIGIAGFFVFYKLMPYLPQPKKHLRIARIARYEGNELPLEILKLLSFGLTTIGPDGAPLPGMAKSWEISEDGLTYTFTLQDNLKWQDETPIYASQIDYQFADVEKTVLADKTIRFKLKEPFSPFLNILSRPIFKKNFLGLGPYQLKRIKKISSIIEKVTLDSPEQNLVFHFYPTQEKAILGFKLGEVDVMDHLLKVNLEENFLKSVNVEKSLDKNQYLGIFFNTQNPQVADKTFRQTLAYGLKDKPVGEQRATGPISPLSWAYSNEVKLYQFDSSKALEIIKKDNKKDKIIISTTEPFLEEAEIIKKSWTEVLGLEVSIELINILASDYQVFLGIQEIPSDPDQYVLWHSTRNENITRLKNPKIDKLLEDGRKILSREDRKEKYFDFQKTISEELPVIFLSHPTYFQITRKKVFTWL